MPHVCSVQGQWRSTQNRDRHVVLRTSDVMYSIPRRVPAQRYKQLSSFRLDESFSCILFPAHRLDWEEVRFEGGLTGKYCLRANSGGCTDPGGDEDFKLYGDHSLGQHGRVS